VVRDARLADAREDYTSAGSSVNASTAAKGRTADRARSQNRLLAPATKWTRRLGPPRDYFFLLLALKVIVELATVLLA
jgi:hypothetical protein